MAILAFVTGYFQRAAVALKVEPDSLVQEMQSESNAFSSYDHFRQHFGTAHHRSNLSEDARRDLFAVRRMNVLAHNAQGASWSAGLNHFADLSDEERQQWLGYTRGASRRGAVAPPGASSFLEVNGQDGARQNERRVWAKARDWRQMLTSGQFVRNQGACGSCWAQAAVGALEMHRERHSGRSARLAVQQIIDCTPNPNHCGGAGGCKGATSELAFEYVTGAGIQEEGQQHGHENCQSIPSSGVQISGWQVLPQNQLEPLLEAVSNAGPTVVSVAAGSDFYHYHSGVYAGCAKDAILNHAMLCTGYGSDEHGDYWLVRNSWSDRWGENGYMRILRHQTSDEYCGVDTDPKKGLACDGGPSEVRVCGMCGILYDSTYPMLGQAGSDGMIASHG